MTLTSQNAGITNPTDSAGNSQTVFKRICGGDGTTVHAKFLPAT